MKELLGQARARLEQTCALIRRLVECETPSGDAAAIERFADLLAAELPERTSIRRISGGNFGPHLRCCWPTAGASTEGQILLLAHSDTVWPAGTLAGRPFRRWRGRLWGPGVLDMKAGIAIAIEALRLLEELGRRPRRRVVLLVNSDEEIGSPSSRPWIEREACRSAAVLVLEPGTGLEGKLKTARKGVGVYSLRVTGRAAHAGVDFAAGANAVLELARQIQRVASFTDLRRGVTVSPNVARGGDRSNVIPEEAIAEVDVRVPRLRDAARLDARMRALRPFDARCRLEVSGGLNRPPMERSHGTVQLFALARSLAAEMGVVLEESTSGGGSDGNFTAALGVPTLDGLGAVGEGAHAGNESVLVARIPERVALLAGLLERV
ncbi:MAG: M20 family metallopeptidase [Bryobacterales bacterium]|nr:M20 family metallopeptidase [Bryobacteraceae bacterium]MDW8129326.1 M20 family metallopeptidase [Bryobacterales bacterium]